MPRTTLITGAAGFIGSHLARALLGRGDHVVGVDSYDAFYARERKLANTSDLDPTRFELVEADIRDREAMATLTRRRRPDLVVHLAALAGVRPSILDPRRYASVNVDGLVSVLDAAREADVGRVVFASSSSVYGNQSTVPFSEECRADAPISPYAATKRAGELICSTYSHLFGLRLATLRFFTVYGPAQRPDLAIAKFMRMISAGEEIVMYGDGTSSRDYTFVDDIVGGVLAAVARIEEADAGFCRVYNLGGSSPTPLRELIDAVAETVGRPARVRQMPMQPGDVDRTWADLTRSRPSSASSRARASARACVDSGRGCRRATARGSDGARAGHPPSLLTTHARCTWCRPKPGSTRS